MEAKDRVIALIDRYDSEIQYPNRIQVASIAQYTSFEKLLQLGLSEGNSLRELTSVCLLLMT